MASQNSNVESESSSTMSYQQQQQQQPSQQHYQHMLPLPPHLAQLPQSSTPQSHAPTSIAPCHPSYVSSSSFSLSSPPQAPMLNNKRRSPMNMERLWAGDKTQLSSSGYDSQVGYKTIFSVPSFLTIL